MCFIYKSTGRLKVKGEKKIHHANSNQKKALTNEWKTNKQIGRCTVVKCPYYLEQSTYQCNLYQNPCGPLP